MKKDSTMPGVAKQGVGLVVGLDLGDRWSYYCRLEEHGNPVEEGRVKTTPAAMREWLGQQEAGLVVLEVGTHSSWVSREVEASGARALVADARRVEVISKNVGKSDRSDAELLARLGRADEGLLKPIQHRSARAQADLTLIRARDALVRARTQLINTARGLVKGTGERLPACSAEAFAARVSEEVPPGLRAALRPVLDAIRVLTQKIGKLDGEVRKVARKYPETKGLEQIPGVGVLTALAYVLTLEDPRRFGRSRQVGAYLGMTPARAQSGSRDPQKGISKAGDGYLRRLLVSSAHYILGPFGPSTALREWGLRLAMRGGGNGKKRAVVAVARKLAVLLHRLWSSGAVYQPFPAA